MCTADRADLIWCGDWEALYVDGELDPTVEQNHSLRLEDAMRAMLGVGAFASREVTDEWAESVGKFPQYLDEIPQEAFV